jgi:hypothetical protein
MEMAADFHEFDRALSPHELAYQEALVQERENEIREIETGIHELNEITRDLGTIITEQGSMIGESSYQKKNLFQSTAVSVCSRPPAYSENCLDLPTLTASVTDNIESNISSVEVNVREADRELTTAADYQRKAGQRGACLMIIIAIVVTIVLVAVCVLLFCPATCVPLGVRELHARDERSLFIFHLKFWKLLANMLRLFVGSQLAYGVFQTIRSS